MPSRCKSNGRNGKKRGGCQNKVHKNGLCWKCLGLGIISKQQVKKVLQEGKENRIETTEGEVMTPEYIHLSFLKDVTDAEREIMKDMCYFATNIYGYLTIDPTKRPAASRVLILPKTKKEKEMFEELMKYIFNVMTVFEYFQEILANLSFPSYRDGMFIVANPEKIKRNCGAFHRDSMDKTYTVFFFLSSVTKDNGAVNIVLNSSGWPRDYRRGKEEVLRHHHGYNSVDMMGDQCDLFAFDGRLLHQSLRNTTRCSCCFLSTLRLCLLN